MGLEGFREARPLTWLEGGEGFLRGDFFGLGAGKAVLCVGKTKRGDMGGEEEGESCTLS